MQAPPETAHKEEEAVNNKAKSNHNEVSEDVPEADTTLFVKNLNFETTDEVFRKHFEQSGEVYSAAIAKKKDPQNPGQVLSMGYGFVQFWTKKATVTALKDLQGSMLDDHVIELKVFIVNDSFTLQFLTVLFFLAEVQPRRK